MIDRSIDRSTVAMTSQMMPGAMGSSSSKGRRKGLNRTSKKCFGCPKSGRKRRYRRTIGTVDGCRTAGGRTAGGRSSDGRQTDVGQSSAAPVLSRAPKEKSFDRGGPVWPPRSNAKDDRTAPKKKSFDRGGPVWPPRSNAKDDHVGGGPGGLRLPQPKIGWSEGLRPPAKTD